jgi:hypothetical protein
MSSNLEKALLKCEISKGMFSNERAVKVLDFSGEVIEMFAWDRSLRDDRLEVRVLGRNDAGAVWVDLPSMPFNSGTVIVVNSDDLAALDAAK